MGLWYTRSRERCHCCCWTCCCRCRPKQTTPAFVGAFTLLGSAIVLTLMLTGGMSIGYYSVPIFGFAASFSLLCYVGGIHKYSVPQAARPQQSSSLQQIRPQPGDTPGLDAWINDGPRTLERQHTAAASAAGATSQRNTASSTATPPTTVQQNSRPGSAEGSATPVANMAQHRNAGASTSVVSNGSVRAVSASRTSTSTRVQSPDYGLASEGGDRARPTVNLSQGLVDERQAPNSDAPAYFDVVFSPPPLPPAERCNSTAMQAGRPGMTQSWTRRHPVLDERETSSTLEISLEPLPTYDSIFPSGPAFLAADP